MNDEEQSEQDDIEDGDEQRITQEEDDSENDQDPVAEGETLPENEKVEPSYEKASAIPFFEVCRRLEKLWQLRRDRGRFKKIAEIDKLKALLPPKMIDYLGTPKHPGAPPESFFPLFRLLMPEKDSSRMFLMKESALFKAYTGAFNLSPNSKDYQKLLHFKDATVVQDQKAVGDFSCVLKNVLRGRIVHDSTEKTGSDFTVGDINVFLDELASVRFRHKAAKEAFERAKRSASPSKKKSGKPPTQADFWIDLIRRLNQGNKNLSPLEHKWLVRIIRQEMQFGLGWKSILKWYNKHAIGLYDAHTSLKSICKILCDPSLSSGFLRQDKDEDDSENKKDDPLSTYLVKSMAAVVFGTPLSPMFSARTFSDRLMNEISARHRAFAAKEKSESTSEEPSPAADSLSFRFPAFSVETKLDGERMIVHLSRDGVVKIHSRVGNWYSNSYSPVLGPAIRRALARFNVDVIIDGEILAWDSVRKEVIPFGQNRTVAKLRRTWMQKHNMLDPRDLRLHAGDKDAKEVRMAFVSNKSEEGDEEDFAGQECWLLFCAFDILYIAGPDAETILKETISPHVKPPPEPGSMIDLDGYERKKLLHKLIEEQKHEVELVQTWIVRPTGQAVDGNEYFSPDAPTMECGLPAHQIDSQRWTLNQNANRVQTLDAKRTRGRSDDQVSLARAAAVDKIYRIMVEERRQEGLLFKDLCTPYYLGERSKSFKYWHKYKPDYEKGEASDLDLVIIGAYFATGLRHAGKPSSFLLACVDSHDPERFFPLCKVNAGSMIRSVLDNLYQSTGFTMDEETNKIDWGDKWFNEKDRKTIPDFVSTRSLDGGEDSTWRPKKDDYPDMWISPMDSRILTLNAGEIVSSDFFSAGLTLRFPRVTALRDQTDKDVTEIENEDTLWEMYQTKEEHRSEGQAAENIKFGSPSPDPGCPRRFLTEEEFDSSKKRKKKSSATKKLFKAATIEEVGQQKSNVLQNLIFTVLGGTYHLDKAVFDIDQEDGDTAWLNEAEFVRSSDDVKRFIRQHDGELKLSPEGGALVVGGSESDAEVVNYIQAIENAHARLSQRKGKPTKQSLQDEKTAQSSGVLNWTFVYTLVHERLSGSKFGPPTPSILDYLARPSKIGAMTVDPLLELCTETIDKVRDLKRALHLVSKLRNRDEEQLTWQECTKTLLSPEDQWVAKSKFQKMLDITLYADIFEYPNSLPCAEDFASIKIESALPLARIMGAVITSELDESVTHILCDLASEDEILVSDDIGPDAFNYPERGRQLLRKVRALSQTAVLVSPGWIRKRKWHQD